MHAYLCACVRACVFVCVFVCACVAHVGIVGKLASEFSVFRQIVNSLASICLPLTTIVIISPSPTTVRALLPVDFDLPKLAKKHVEGRTATITSVLCLPVESMPLHTACLGVFFRR